MDLGIPLIWGQSSQGHSQAVAMSSTSGSLVTISGEGPTDYVYPVFSTWHVCMCAHMCTRTHTAPTAVMLEPPSSSIRHAASLLDLGWAPEGNSEFNLKSNTSALLQGRLTRASPRSLFVWRAKIADGSSGVFLSNLNTRGLPPQNPAAVQVQTEAALLKFGANPGLV